MWKFGNILGCPVCCHSIVEENDRWICTALDCKKQFKVHRGKPILINEANSLFNASAIIANADKSRPAANAGRFRPLRLVRKLIEAIPEVNGNLKYKENMRFLADHLLSSEGQKTGLLIGAGDSSVSLAKELEGANCRLVKTDICVSEEVDVVCDAHNLPFKDGSMDFVICQAVLEHVEDPRRCVSEITRVLKTGAVVYAETPFNAPAHMGGRYDYTRFTSLGHRGLFRRFSEMKQGVSCGPGMALAESIKYFLFSFSAHRKYRGLIDIFYRKVLGLLKLADYFLIDKPGAMDAASGVYFIGKKTEHEIPLQELPNLYRGALS